MKVKIKFTGEMWSPDKKGKEFEAEIKSFVVDGTRWETGAEGWEIGLVEEGNTAHEVSGGLPGLLGQRVKMIEFMEQGK